jgi:hypothetical protein
VLACVALALALACDHFQADLNSDLLWPQVFVHDLGDPLHPVAGWTFGSATFWLPDYLLFLPLYWICGNSGLGYPLYVMLNFLLTGAMMSWALTAVGIEKKRALLAGFLAVNIALLTQFLPGHGGWLWLLGIPCDHGGSVPTGFAIMALVLGAARAGRWSRRRSLATVVVLALALAEDSLTLVHWVAPVGLALAWQAWRARELRPVFWGFVVRAGLALAFAVTQRITLAFAQVFFFSKLLQYPPTPAYIWESFSHFINNFFAGGVFTGHWLLWILGAAGIVAALDGLRPLREVDDVKRVALLAGLLSLLFAWMAPIATVYWVNPTSIRYLLNWLVLPAWLVALRFVDNPRSIRWLPRLAIFTTVLGMVFSSPRISTDKMFFPHPPGAEALEAFCARHDLREGLADFWHTHLLAAEWRFGGPRVGNIADDFFPCFWCNNAFDYFPAAENDRGLVRPAPQFIILDGLDPQHVAQWVGGSTLTVAHVGGYSVAILTPEQTERAGERIYTQTLDLLQGRRADWLKAQLPPPS